MEIKSLLLRDDDFKFVKQSLIDVSEVDGEQKFRVDTLEYINDTADDEDDDYFYDMLTHVRFLYPDNDAVAYTTPDTIISLNCPGKFKNIRYWDTIYDHECLHQLWDTFEVEERVKKNDPNGYCDREILNIASDCVINDYLLNIRKKPLPDGCVTPELLKTEFNVVYDRKQDTQFTLYLKLLEKAKEIKNNNNIKNALDKISGKITPKSVKKQQGPTPPPTPPGPPPSPDFVKGWTDAINDTINKKVDPLTYTPKNTNSDYDQGYDAAMANIKKGLEDGITLQDNPSKEKNGGGGLPQIPWDIPKDQQQQQSSDNGQSDSQPENANDAQDAADQAQDAADKAQDAANKAQDAADQAKSNGDNNASEKQDAANKAQNAANKAKEEAKKAQDAANKAKDAAKKGDKKGEKSASKEAGEHTQNAVEAQKEAEGQVDNSQSDGSDINSMSASEAATDAQSSANKADEAAKQAKDAANKAQSSENKNNAKKSAEAAEEYAKKAKEEAQKAVDAAKKGDTDEARKAAKAAKDAKRLAEEKAEEAKDMANGKKFDKEQLPVSGTNSSSTQSNKVAGSQHGTDSPPFSTGNMTDVDLEHLRKHGQDTIKKAQNTISGALAEFTKKCKLSAKCEKSGMTMPTTNRGVSSWNQQMDTAINAFVKNKIFQKQRQYQSTYSRVKRGSGFIKFGQPIQPGRRIRDDKLLINVAFYIDKSGSMSSGNAIEHVFKATYTLAESMKKLFGGNAIVEDIGFKLFVFDYSIHELPWGKKITASGGTCEFDKVFKFISENTADHLINIIITDAESSVDERAVDNCIKNINGMVMFISNEDKPEMKQLAKKYNDKIFYILADSQFTIK